MTEREDIEKKVLNTVNTILKPNNAPDLDSNFADDLGADSLGLVELMMALEDVFQCQIPDEDASKIVTVRDVVNYIEKKKQELTPQTHN